MRTRRAHGDVLEIMTWSKGFHRYLPPKKELKRKYGVELPDEMRLHRIEIKAGRSSQSTLLGRNDITYESIYLSAELIACLDLSPEELAGISSLGRASQLELPILGG